MFMEWYVKPNIFHLMLAHQRAESALRLEAAHRYPDAWRIMLLKKVKLQIKDRLHALAMGSRRLNPA
jgi:hypothetical protein